MYDRRELLRLASLFTAAGALPLLQACSKEADKTVAESPLKIGYLPITDATPLLVAHDQGLFEAEGVKADKPALFRSWSQLVEAFISGQVNVVHLLSPMTVWARYGSQSPSRVVMWNHMAGSALTVRPEVDDVKALGGKTVAIPFWYSIHNIVLQHLLRESGLEPTEADKPSARQVRLVVMAPSDMPPALAGGQIAGFIVAEPFNAAAEIMGVGKVLRFTADVWRDHACCLTLMHEHDLQKRPQWVQKVVNALVKAQAWTLDHRAETAALMAKGGRNQYTPHSEEALLRVLHPAKPQWDSYAKSGVLRHPQWMQQRIDFQPFPFPSYTEELVRMLKKTHVSGNNSFLDALEPAKVAADLVEPRFVRQAIEQQKAQALFRLPADFTRREEISA